MNNESHAVDIYRGQRFAFGDDGERFLSVGDEARVVYEEASQKQMRGLPSLRDGRSLTPAKSPNFSASRRVDSSRRGTRSTTIPSRDWAGKNGRDAGGGTRCQT